jgi:excisionase family DNA binding protein
MDTGRHCRRISNGTSCTVGSPVGPWVLEEEGGESVVRVVNSRDSDLLTLAEAAAYLRVHRRTMSRLLRQRVVPGTKIGRQWRVRRADLDAALAARTVPESSGGQPVVLVANDPPLAREAIARALQEVRPDIDTIAVDPAVLAGDVARYQPDLAVVSERNSTVEATVPSWVLLSPDGGTAAITSVVGRRQETAHLSFADLVAFVDRTARAAS